MALARAFANAGEHRDPLIALHHCVDQFHHHDGLADAGATEHRRLAALRQRRQQIDDLDAGFEDGGGGSSFAQAMAASDGSAREASPRATTVHCPEHWPVTSRRRPRMGSPTGTVIGPPVDRTGTPRFSPAVA